MVNVKELILKLVMTIKSILDKLITVFSKLVPIFRVLKMRLYPIALRIKDLFKLPHREPKTPGKTPALQQPAQAMQKKPAKRKPYIIAGIAVAGAVAVLVMVYLLPGLPQAEKGLCSDSDQERLPTLKGECADPSGKAADVCITKDELLEYWCEEDACNFIKIYCSTLGLSCKDGACGEFEEEPGHEEPGQEQPSEIEDNETVTGNETTNQTEVQPNQTVKYNLPDLIVDSMNYKYVNSTTMENQNGTQVPNYDVVVTFSATVINIGDYPSDQTGVKIEILEPFQDEGYKSNNEFIFEGDAITLDSEFQVLNYTGTFEVRVTVDWSDKIKEINEENNVYFFTLEFGEESEA